MNNYEKHAEIEFRAAGWLNEDGTFKDAMQKAICEHVMALLDVFEGEGHSGSSATYAIDLFSKLAKFEPIVPLTGKSWEWNEIGTGRYQNKRCSHVFKDHDRFDGQAYDIDAVIFWEWCERQLEEDEDGYPGISRYKSYFTSRDSSRPITFPYTPKREYQERNT
jgi:hypothetical protein